MAERVLVIFLSSALALFLILAIVATIFVIQILKHLKHVSEKAVNFADKAEAVGDFFERAAKPLAAARIMGDIAESFFKRKKKRRSERDE